MVFVACGLNHKTAPITIREKIAPTPAAQEDWLRALISLPGIEEAALLSTCNRTEIYCQTTDPTQILPWLADEHQLSLETIADHTYIYSEQKAIKHALRVASGLDSMMLGEPQIFGQMKQAYQQGCQIGSVQQQLRQIFEYVFSASKRIRHHSGIGQHAISIAYAAVQRITDLFHTQQPLTIFVIGSGETAALVAKYLHKQNRHQFVVVGRSLEKAQQLAETFHAQALPIDELESHLPSADVVISATACPLPFITKSLVNRVLARRNHQAMFFLDLAVPRDIEPSVAELEHVYLYNIDELQQLTEQGLDKRRHAAAKAEQLVEQELEQYVRQHRSRQANQLICHYREKMQDTAQVELQRALQKLSNGHSEYQVLNEFSTRLVNKLLHHPTIGLRQAAWDDKPELLDLAHYLFNTLTHPS